MQCGQLNMLLQLYQEVTTDELTGMMNRRLLMKQLEKARVTMIRKQASLPCCCWIWTRFKLASMTASAIWRGCRSRRWRRLPGGAVEPGMVPGRYGGEVEFAILLPNRADLAQGETVAERLRWVGGAAGSPDVDERWR